MKLLMTLTCAAFSIGQVHTKTLSQPNVGVLVDPSGNGVKIDIHIELAALHSDANLTAHAQNKTKIALPNSTTLNQTIASAPCPDNGHTSVRETPTPPSTVTTLGFFPNSTRVASATGNFQSPSLIDLAAFSNGASEKVPSALIIAMAMVWMIGI